MPLARDGCSRICSCQSIREHCETTTFTIAAANHSITNRWKRSISTDFNSSLKLVRDQGVGGSNPLSPTNIFNSLQPSDPHLKIHCRRFCGGESLANQQAVPART